MQDCVATAHCATAPVVLGTHLALALRSSWSAGLGCLAAAAHMRTQAATRAPAASDAAYGGVWGFARVLRLEHAGLRVQSVDISRGVSTACGLHGSATEAEVAWRGAACFGARLRCTSTPSTRAAAVSTGAYAITGGLGGLGLRAAALLMERGASRVVLASRSGRVVRDGQGLARSLHRLARVQSRQHATAQRLWT